MSASPLVIAADTGAGVRTLTLNRPQKRNALSVELIGQLTDAVRAASAGPGLRVLILRAAGPAFCAGLDLSEAAASPEAAGRSAEALAALYLEVARSPLVTIAAAKGAAIGGGAGLLVACDLAVAAEDLGVGFPEVHRGLVAALVTCLLRRQLGDRTTRELILLGQRVPAARALSLGLVNRVVALAELDAAAAALADEARRGAPGAIARTKRLLDDLGARPIAEELQLALRHHLEARLSDEAAEGVAAFREKREPRW
jgi:methylglutaconyl-CoA hydratase